MRTRTSTHKQNTPPTGWESSEGTVKENPCGLGILNYVRQRYQEAIFEASEKRANCPKTVPGNWDSLQAWFRGLPRKQKEPPSPGKPAQDTGGARTLGVLGQAGSRGVCAGAVHTRGRSRARTGPRSFHWWGNRPALVSPGIRHARACGTGGPWWHLRLWTTLASSQCSPNLPNPPESQWRSGHTRRSCACDLGSARRRPAAGLTSPWLPPPRTPLGRPRRSALPRAPCRRPARSSGPGTGCYSRAAPRPRARFGSTGTPPASWSRPGRRCASGSACTSSSQAACSRACRRSGRRRCRTRCCGEKGPLRGAGRERRLSPRAPSLRPDEAGAGAGTSKTSVSPPLGGRGPELRSQRGGGAVPAAAAAAWVRRSARSSRACRPLLRRPGGVVGGEVPSRARARPFPRARPRRRARGGGGGLAAPASAAPGAHCAGARHITGWGSPSRKVKFAALWLGSALSPRVPRR